MLHRFVRSARHSAVKVLITLAVPMVALWAGANDVIFTKPVAGSVHYVGDAMRVEFHLADTSVVVCRDMMGFTSDDGFLWGYLPLFMNCTDTISAQKHYDWTIPVELDDSRSSRMIPTVGAACRMSIHDYEPITMRGQSETFTILPDSLRPVVVVTKPVAGDTFFVGETVRFEFHLSSPSSGTCGLVLGFTPDGGLNWSYLPTAAGGAITLTCGATDTISQTGHYDWKVPASFTSGLTGQTTDPVGNECAFSVNNSGALSTQYGRSATFTILPAPKKEESKSGCGSGAGLALLPPLAIKLASKRRRNTRG